MSKHRVILQGIVGSLATFGLVAIANAAAPDVIVTDAKIEAGKLVVTGKTAIAGMRVRLDGRSQADFNTTSASNRTFRFSIVYLPKDCIVSVQKVQGSQLGVATDAVIANCAPSGITPRGSWDDKTSYEGLDLVSHEGASWLAMRDKVKTEPGKSRDWQLFAGKGNDGKAGSSGADGGGRSGGSSAGALAAPNPEAIPTGPAGGDLNGTYPNPQIALGAVVTNRLASGAVTGGKIKNFSVTTNKIADDAVTSAKIADGAVTSTKLATDSVGAAQIAADSVGSSEIAPGVVGADELDTIHEHTGPATNIIDATAHDGAYASAQATVACGLGEELLSVSIRWTNTGGHNELVFSGVQTIDRTTDPKTATVLVAYDGGAAQATFVPVATCIF